MKSAEDWAKEWIGPDFNKDSSLVKKFKVIQQDAIASARDAALVEAANIAEKHFEDQNFNAMYRQAGYEINAVILALRTKPTTSEQGF